MTLPPVRDDQIPRTGIYCGRQDDTPGDPGTTTMEQVKKDQMLGAEAGKDEQRDEVKNHHDHEDADFLVPREREAEVFVEEGEDGGEDHAHLKHDSEEPVRCVRCDTLLTQLLGNEVIHQLPDLLRVVARHQPGGGGDPAVALRSRGVAGSTDQKAGVERERRCDSSRSYLGGS